MVFFGGGLGEEIHQHMVGFLGKQLGGTTSLGRVSWKLDVGPQNGGQLDGISGREGWVGADQIEYREGV